MPISYKQFSNMLSKKNKIYKLMKAINGENDILKKIYDFYNVEMMIF